MRPRFILNTILTPETAPSPLPPNPHKYFAAYVKDHFILLSKRPGGQDSTVLMLHWQVCNPSAIFRSRRRLLLVTDPPLSASHNLRLQDAAYTFPDAGLLLGILEDHLSRRRIGYKSTGKQRIDRPHYPGRYFLLFLG